MRLFLYRSFCERGSTLKETLQVDVVVFALVHLETCEVLSSTFGPR